MLRIVQKEELYGVIDGFLRGYEVIGPQELPGKGIFYQSITNAQDLYLGERFTVEPVKKFFLRPSEHLFQGGLKEGSEFLEDIPLAQNKRMIIGVRPCEVRGLTLLDKIFNAEYIDDTYVSLREKTMLIGLSCQVPGKDCFCTSIGGSPVQSRGMDALIFSIGSKYIIEIITDKGKEVFGVCGKEPDKAEMKTWESFKEKNNAALRKKIKVPENLDNIFASDYWGKASSACISCGVCTYLCPTCHCFDLVDQGRKKLRCYDGCAFSDFTLEASGGNPRPTKMERYRQRVFHKFNYFRKNFGENLCVGCGRCIRHCPVKMNIAEIIDNAPI